MAIETRLRISVRVNSREDRAAATEILSRFDSDVHQYDGLVTGWATRETIAALMERGFMIDESSGDKSAPAPQRPQPPPLPGAPDPTALSNLFEELQAKAKAAADNLTAARPAGRVARFAAGALDAASNAMVAAASSIAPATGDLFGSPLNVFGSTMNYLSKGVLGASRGLLGAGAALRLPVTAPDETMYEVELVGPMRPEWADKLRACNARIASYIPPFRYRMPLTSEQLAQVRALDFVRSAERYSLKATLAQTFLDALQEAKGTGERVPKTFDLTVHLPGQISAVNRLLETQSGVDVVDRSGDKIRFRAVIDDPFLLALADREEVKTLEAYTPPVLLDHCRVMVGASAINGGSSGPWDGKGEIVAILDSGVDRGHPDLADRVKSYDSVQGATATDTQGHGTHVAGIIAGTGKASGGKITGIAPGAQLCVLGIVNANNTVIFPIDPSKYLTAVTASGAKIVNMSLGFKGTKGAYDSNAEKIDEFVYNNPEVLVVVAAGNDGQAPSGYPNYRNVNSPATGKNVISVGACNTSRPDIATTWGGYNGSLFPSPPLSSAAMAGPPTPTGLSSRGPSIPKAIKPDVLAPGTFVLSAQAAGAALQSYAVVPPETGPYIYLNGTSMAAPFVSGAAAVLRQYLRETLNLASPSAALMKAMLCASAERCAQLVNPAAPPIGYPDFDQGFGLVNLARLIPHKTGDKLRMAFVDVANNSSDALASRQAADEGGRRSRRAYRLKIGENAGPLQVVLSWTDVPGSGVQNILQLTVQGPSVALPGNHEHTFERNPLFEAEELQGIPYDEKNNTQIVYVKNPAAGDYSINIFAEQTPNLKPQGYALCACGDLASGIELPPVAF